MLGKLLKLDIRFGYKKFVTMIAVMLLGGLLVPILTDVTGTMGLMIVFMFGMVLIAILSVWLIVQHFYKNFFSSEGYLMFTLPVKSGTLLLSKVITTLVWFNIMVIVAVIMILLLSRDQVTFARAWQMIKTPGLLPELLQAWILLNAIAIPMIMSIYTGLSLSTVAIRNRSIGLVPGVGIAGALLFGFFWCQSKISDAVWQYYSGQYNYFDSFYTEPSFMQRYGDTVATAALALVFSVVLFFATNYIMKRRLNLK